jgi:hypothetical protein
MQRTILPILVSAAVALPVAAAADERAGDTASALDESRRRVLAEVFAMLPSTLDLDENGIPADWMVVQGDILVPEGAATSTYQGNLWPNGDVYYFFDGNTTTEQREAMLAAMAEWESYATIDFQPWVGQANRIRIRDSSDDLIPLNNSAVGMVGGEQVINIVDWDSNRTLMHELAHSLGVHHEQTRNDRDEYVVIEWGHIPIEYWGNFITYPGTSDFGAYDYESIMHYKACAFSICGSQGCIDNPDICRTITTLDPSKQDVIGEADEPSALDILSMSFLYPQPGWRFVDETYSGDSFGTFVQPWQTFTEGYSAEPAGTTLHLEPGSYFALGTWSKAMTIKAPLGGVTLATD